MTINYGFLSYDEPKKASEKELPKKTFEFIVKDSSDIRSIASSLSDDIYENLAGKTKFRFYIENGLGANSVYQVNFTKESRDFFELELMDDLRTLIKM